MSIMNLLSITLIILILGAGIALFFGMRTANATPIVAHAPAAPALTAPDAVNIRTGAAQ